MFFSSSTSTEQEVYSHTRGMHYKYVLQQAVQLLLFYPKIASKMISEGLTPKGRGGGGGGGGDAPRLLVCALSVL